MIGARRVKEDVRHEIRQHGNLDQFDCAIDMQHLRVVKIVGLGREQHPSIGLVGDDHRARRIAHLKRVLLGDDLKAAIAVTDRGARRVAHE